MSDSQQNIKKQSLHGVKWSAIERFTNQGISFIIGIILARLLTPSDYGTIGEIGIFTTIIGSFVDSGFSSALIRKLDRTEVDCSTVFYFNIVMSVLCYGIMFVAAPYIADFFKEPILTDVVRVICLEIIINAFGAVQTARFNWQVNFKKTANASILSTVISGIVGITMAYSGLGVWSLVWQTLVFSIVNVTVLWIIARWHPIRAFSWQSFKEMFSFGGKLLVSGLLHTVYTQLDVILVGKFYNASQLGLWSRAKHLVSYPSLNITEVLGRVTYPILSKLQNDDSALISAYRKYIGLTSMIIFFLMMLLCAVAKPLTILLLTEKWEACIIFIQILCFSFMFNHINRININLLYVKGRSDLVLKLEVFKKAISIGILFLCIPFGVRGFAIGSVTYCQIAIIFNTYYTGKMFKFGYWQQLKDYMPYWFISLLACTPCFLLCHLMPSDSIMSLVVGSFTALLIYSAILYFRCDILFMSYILQPLRNRLNRRKS